jgi:hypothetical protein
MRIYWIWKMMNGRNFLNFAQNLKSMKRAILFLISLTLCVLSYGKITNSIWNLKLGISNRQQVEYEIKRKGLNIGQQNQNVILCYNSIFSFGGYYWNFASFKFYKGKLARIIFSNSDSSHAKDTFNSLNADLHRKFSNYLEEENLTVYGKSFVTFNDDITSLELLYNSKNGDSFVAITYENDKLVLEEQHDSYSEL